MTNQDTIGAQLEAVSMGAVLKKAVRALERATQVRIARPNSLGSALEVEHLRRLFALLAVDCVLDVGANAGQYADMLRGEVGYRGWIVSFEPIPRLASQLARKARQDGKWLVRDLALDDAAGPATFHVAEQDTFSSLLLAKTDEYAGFSKAASSKPISVMRARLDAVLPDLIEATGCTSLFLKMDTQGNDIAVARGAGDRLRMFKGIQTEMSVRATYTNAPSYVETIRFFEDAGFALSAIIHNHPWQFPKLVEADALFYNPSRL